MKAIDSYGNYIAFDEVIEKEYKLCYEMLERNKGDFFNVVNNKDAMKGYDHISKRARHTKYAPLSLYRSAVISLYNKKYADSVDKFEGFLQKYPKHEYVPQAYLGLMRTLVRSALETHGDSASFRKALFVRSKMRKLFPDTEILKQAEAYVAMARKAQAAHLLYLASFYQRKVHYRPHASKIYIETILSDYSDTESAQKAQDLLAKLPKKLDPLPEPGSLTPKSN